MSFCLSFSLVSRLYIELEKFIFTICMCTRQKKSRFSHVMPHVELDTTRERKKRTTQWKCFSHVTWMKYENVCFCHWFLLRIYYYSMIVWCLPDIHSIHCSYENSNAVILFRENIEMRETPTTHTHTQNRHRHSHRLTHAFTHIYRFCTWSILIALYIFSTKCEYYVYFVWWNGFSMCTICKRIKR